MLKNEKDFLDIVSAEDFRGKALETFRFQYAHNPVYRQWVQALNVSPEEVHDLPEIPFLPIAFFKDHTVFCGDPAEAEITFTSSGTTGSVPSRHSVRHLSLYEESFLRCFELFYGHITDYCILALLPGYLDRQGSSLVYMAHHLIKASGHPLSGFYLRDHAQLLKHIHELKRRGQKTLLLGVSYALLDLCEHSPRLGDTFVVMETGGMKGNRPEMLKSQLHETLARGLGVTRVHSEYGMTEMLSQAYSKGDGLFECPPWLRFMVREVDDPLQMRSDHRTGGINIIDLANRYSCSFIATQDLGRITHENKLELMGRFDHSDVRGCNLMIGNP